MSLPDGLAGGWGREVCVPRAFCGLRSSVASGLRFQGGRAAATWGALSEVTVLEPDRCDIFVANQRIYFGYANVICNGVGRGAFVVPGGVPCGMGCIVGFRFGQWLVGGIPSAARPSIDACKVDAHVDVNEHIHVSVAAAAAWPTFAYMSLMVP